MSRKVIAIFGATGGQGASVGRALTQCSGEFDIRGLTRDVTSAHAQQMVRDGVTVIPYNPFDRNSLESAVVGAYGVFVNTVTDYNDPDCFENEKTQGRMIADACKAMGVQHVVFSSQLHTTRISGVLVRHMVAKAEIYDYMRDIGLPVTCLIMPIYYEDFCDMFKPMTRDGRHFELIIPTGFTPLDMMSVEDLGPVVVNVLRHKDHFMHKTISPSGCKLTMGEVASALSQCLAPKVFRDKQLTVEEFRQLGFPGAGDWAQMFKFLVREDQRYKVRDTREQNPKLQTFGEWLMRNRACIDRVMS